MAYIEREDALESLCTGCEYVPIEEKEVCPYRFTGCQEYANIFAIPAADVVPVRHGRWVHPAPGDGEPYCSVCHAEAEYFYGYGSFEPDFCPSCGARMDMVTDCNQVKDGDGK